MYITESANFGYGYQSSDPWLDPYYSSFYGTAGGAGGPTDWRYNDASGTYYHRWSGERLSGDEFNNKFNDPYWTYNNFSLLNGSSYSRYAVFETGTSLDHGRTFIGNGNFGIAKIGIVMPTNNNLLFTSKKSAEYFLKYRAPWFTLDPNDKIIASVGLFGTLLSSNKGTFRIRKSGHLSLGYYLSGWRTGNQYVKKLYSISKLGSGVSLGGDVYLSYNAYNKIFAGQSQLIDFSDAGFGTAGIVNSTYGLLYGSSIPVLGEAVALYGIFRLTMDVFYDLGVQYGPFF